MYRASDLKTGLGGLFGWRQNENTLDFTIADSLTTSSTGQYYQDVHPLLSLDNIKAVAPDFLKRYPKWESQNYAIGSVVVHSDKVYKALVINPPSTPSDVPTDWEEQDPFSDWLKEKTEGSILKAIRSFWNEKMMEYSAKNILESKTLYDTASRITNTLSNSGDLVGFEFVPLRSKGSSTAIKRVGVHLNGSANFTLYLMHSSSVMPIATKDLIVTSSGGMQWFDLEGWVLPYEGATDAGGSWYVMYHQDNLGSSKAINRQNDYSNSPKGKPLSTSVNSISQYLEVYPIKVSDSSIDSEDVELWDIENNEYGTNTYGLNFQIVVESDATGIILDNKTAFQNVIGLQVAVDMLMEMAYNSNDRTNGRVLNTNQNKILYELDGDSTSNKRSHLKHDLRKALEAVKIDATSMSRVMFKSPKKGIRYSSI